MTETPRNRSMRRPGANSALEIAEAAFRSPDKRPEPDPVPQAKTTVPGAKELVSLRIDGDILAHFQADGPGWRERINAALRRGIEK